ncbi:MAG: bifunctional DNA-formamidopyrimidine glycosylase/DNA-(apurinic or apyrimidinic site) lyase [Gammaproteobacteria bacterium]
MPELPEVESTRRSLLGPLLGRRVTGLALRESRLRWPVPAGLPETLAGQSVLGIDRRAKYLLLRFTRGTLLVHLGMSGSLRLLDPAGAGSPLRRHDHLEFRFDDGTVLRYHDPRRFGSVHWLDSDPSLHPLLRELGPEPLEPGFDGDTLWRASRGRRVPVKQLLMDGSVVVGVGNIYASEALFRAAIDPRRAANRVSRVRYLRLAEAVRAVLGQAVATGGTTLRDYVDGNGQPGEFALRLNVYGREGEACPHCATAIRQVRLGQRSTFFCPNCQR